MKHNYPGELFKYLAKRLKEERGITGTELGKKLGVKDTSIVMYKKLGLAKGKEGAFYKILEKHRALNFLTEYYSTTESLGFIPLINKDSYKKAAANIGDSNFIKDLPTTPIIGVLDPSALNICIVMNGGRLEDGSKSEIADGSKMYCNSLRKALWKKMDPSRAYSIFVDGTIYNSKISIKGDLAVLSSPNYMYESIDVKVKDIKAIFNISYVLKKQGSFG